MVLRKLGIAGLYKSKRGHYPNYYERINQILRLKRINMIVIDGKAQTGKTTLARSICKKYDKNYKILFTIEDFLNHLESCKELYLAGEYRKVYGRWLLFDEPQLETPKQKFWSVRNQIIMAITSSFGFLHNHLVMALPNVKGLQDIVLTNISLRIRVESYLKSNNIIRKGFVKIPIFAEMKQKFIWINVEINTIPLIEEDKEYDKNKAVNFFDNQLTKWRKDLDKDKGKKGDTEINRLKKLLSSGISGQEYIDTLEQYMKLKEG